ncbi:MAG: efflux RND transporter periplasmic adaptor subunit [Acidobacteriota bacterium]
MRTRLPVRHLFLVLALALQAGASLKSEETASASTQVAVHVGTVIRTTLRAYLNTYGLVEGEPAAGGRPAGAAKLTAPVAGLVREVPVTEGQAVKAGDLVVRLEDRMAEAGVQRARARLLLARQALERESILLEQHNTSEKRFQETQQALAAARADLTEAQGVLAQVQLRSPLDGVIARIFVSPGQSVNLKNVLAEVVDRRRLVVMARVPADEAGQVLTGQTAELLRSGHAGDVLTARVSFVSPTVDADTGTVQVRLTLPAESSLRPGKFVRVRIVVDEIVGCLAAPRESVYVAVDGRSTLSVVRSNMARKMVVRVGLEDRGLIQVEGEGLREGMTVVTAGSYALPEKTRVRILSTGEGNGGR